MTDADLTTLVNVPERGVGGDANYRGNWGASFIEMVLRHLMTQTNVRRVNEVFSGSGTTIDVGARLGIAVDGRDLNPSPRRGIGGWDAAAENFDRGCQVLLCHPPYGWAIPYSGHVWGDAPDPRDLSHIPEWGDFIQALNRILVRHYPTVDVGGYIGVLVGDVAYRGRLYSMARDMATVGELVRVIVKAQPNVRSEDTTYRHARRPFVPIRHETFLLMRRTDAYLQKATWTVSGVIDLRRREAQTWRDVVYAALHQLGGSADLQALYREIEGHAKARANEHWQAQVRKVLQISEEFRPVTRGRWALAGKEAAA